MGLAMVCKYQRAERPFFIEQAGLNVYSVEELRSEERRVRNWPVRFERAFRPERILKIWFLWQLKPRAFFQQKNGQIWRSGFWGL